MKVKYIYLFLMLGLLVACDNETIRVSDTITSRELRFTGYSSLRVSNAFNVSVTYSETEESIRVEANENIQDKISIAQEDGTLILKLAKNTNLRGDVTMNVFITTRDLRNFRASGASRIRLENPLVAQQVQIDLSGATNFTGEVEIGSLKLDADGASDLDVFGTIAILDASLSGSSRVRDFDALVQRLKIELSGASDAFLSVSETIDVRASGASTLTYDGSAVIVKESLSGASQITRR
ncbi:MAG: head GIN domain-containing protein [Bacteroidota bacterium]